MSESQLQPGTHIGNYILQELIGEGGFAQVWKAVHHERPGRVVAVKIAVEETYRRQLSREGRLPDIDHPNVVPILDSDTRFSATPYIVMPYLPGGSLADLIAKHPHGPPEERVESLLKDILGGLAAAHSQGIVHRDIKPSNVLLNGDGRALISDFGLSLRDPSPDAAVSIMQSASLSIEQNRALAGTFAYMAPEIMEGAPATKAADVYAVGVILFEMLVGRRPAGPQIPSEKRKDLRRPKMWDALYRRACESVDTRFKDAVMMAKGMDAIVVGPERPLVEVQRPRVPIPSDSVAAGNQEPALDCGDGVMLKLLLVQAGEFLMGAPEDDPDSVWGERPQHRVKITTPFYLGQYPVTQTQWQAVMGNNPSQFKGADRPVETVEWYECKKFCEELSAKTGRVVRLPTEAEWEYACRAGTTTTYSFGDSAADLKEYAWQGALNGAGTQPVGKKKPNSWRLFDMHGNVWEWCQDWYVEAAYRSPGATSDVQARVQRGGSYYSSPSYCRCAARYWSHPAAKEGAGGLRVAVEAQ